ncbi:tyrosine-type recombinase/integrase [Anatilimnocola floriformis]|uniref:tyrosine-type recombinase/integrase n=1 Tax=Anatilimnocola floriformis TaxID=2948575 RepID=UPI0020C30AB2|nr:tyrosine-type recombinase/integrase [Anatilimnocola floriformis]
MPRKPHQAPPAYCLHKASGKAVVRINKQDHYIGLYGTPESHAEYERLIAEFRVAQEEHLQQRDAEVAAAGFTLTLSQVLKRYRTFAQGYYVKNGKPTKELVEMRYALRPLRKLYGNTLAREFGPLKLKAVRQHLVDGKELCRRVINHRIMRIKRFFKWAVSEELVPASVSHGLATVSGLRRGKTTAHEAPPVKPVADVWVDAILPYLSPQVAAMVQLQRLTGTRPGEVVIIRACDIDMSGDVWIYQPQDHKTEWRDHSRTIPLGPKAQQVIRPFLSLSTEQCLFSPRAAEEYRNSAKAENRNPNRKTPIYPCELRARERRRAAAKRRKSKRPKRDHYDVDSYGRAIKYAIKRANVDRAKAKLPLVPNWCPLQLRHSRATEVRKQFGIEGAQVTLGHVHANVTEVYAERNLELAITIARKTG